MSPYGITKPQWVNNNIAVNHCQDWHLWRHYECIQDLASTKSIHLRHRLEDLIDQTTDELHRAQLKFTHWPLENFIFEYK